MRTIAIIGAGYWGKNLIRVFDSIPSAFIKYIVDTDPLITEKYSHIHDVVKTTDYYAVLNDNDVDAVIIASPAPTHYKITSEALTAGKHVFVEKPLTLSVEHSRELVRTAEEMKLKLMVGHLLMYHPCITAIREYIENGDIGELYYLYCQRLNLGKVRSDENVLLSFAPHDISVAVYLMGENPVSVNAYGKSYLQKDIEDVVFLNMYFSGDKIAYVHGSWLDPHKVRRTTVVGSDKMVVFDDMEPREKVRIYDKGVEKSDAYGSYGEFLSLRDGNIFIPAIPMTEPLMLECEHFIDCITNDITPKSDGYNGLVVTRILESAQNSLKNGGIPVVINYSE